MIRTRGNLLKEARSSFLKKRTKKLLRVWAEPLRKSRSRNRQKFFASFFQKRRLTSACTQFPWIRAATLCTLTWSTAWAAAPDGKSIFGENCAMCHQPSGEGAVGLAPALAGTLKDFAGKPDGKTYLSQIAVSGMAGSIWTQGHKFSGLMPSFADRLSDAEIAAVIGYVLKDFNGVAAPVVSVADVAAARARNPTASDTHHVRVALLGPP
jgi:mono/diheme cytochrome c family protein